MMLGIPYRANARVKRPGSGSSRAEIVKRPAGRPVVEPKKHVVPVKKYPSDPLAAGPQ
jgi:hypothetical protein